MQDDLKTEYLTYNGFNRPALFIGIPLIPFVLGMFLILVSFFVGVLTIGFYGLIVPVLILAGLFVLKQMCARDPNAGDLAALKLKGAALKNFRASAILKVE